MISALSLTGHKLERRKAIVKPAIDKATTPLQQISTPAGIQANPPTPIRSSFLHIKIMPVSASKAARLAKKEEVAKAKGLKTPTSKLSSKATSKANSVNGDSSDVDSDVPATDSKKMLKVNQLTEQMDKHGLSDRVTTGVLSSLEQSRDVKITSASLVFHGKVLITDTTLELNFGRRYGLLGENGCGKSTLMKAIAAREYPVPEHVDLYLLNEGAAPSELGALEWVVKQAEEEMARLEKLAEDVLEQEGPDAPQLMDLYEVSTDDSEYLRNY